MRTDMTMLIVVFRNFANAPKNGKAVPIHAVKVCRGSKVFSSTHCPRLHQMTLSGRFGGRTLNNDFIK